MFKCHPLLSENVGCAAVLISNAGVLVRRLNRANVFTELDSNDGVPCFVTFVEVFSLNK